MSHPLLDEKALPSVRWSILRTLECAGHLGATETMVKSVLDTEFFGVTQKIMRDQITYLETRDLVTVARSEVDPWRVNLDRYGWDVAQYQVDCDPGIRRPPRT